MKRTDGGGGIVLIDPASLRRCAATLDGLSTDYGVLASSLRGHFLPSMPAPVSGLVQDGIAQAAATLQAQSQLHDDAVELRCRALWTEFADAYGEGHALGGSELKQFVALLANGTLIRYAEPWQAELAGRWVGETYRETFATDPAKLIELAHILRGSVSAEHPEFSIAFVHAFGGDNLVKVPRVIQAMQWPQMAFSGAMGFDGFADTDLMAQLELDGYELKDDPRQLLASFSLALMVATHAADVSSDRACSIIDGDEDAIASSADSWAVAQLLSQGQVFGKRFLVQVFQKQLIPLVQRDTTGYVAGGLPYTTLPIGDQNIDPKQAILGALARNPEAAANALTSKLPEPVSFVTPWGGVESTDPVEILYHGYWQDHGQGFANVYTAAVDRLQATDVTQANTLTISAIEHVLHGPQDLDPMTRALASDLADHHMESLYAAAGAAVPNDHVWLSPEPGMPIRTGVVALRDLMVKFDDDSQAAAIFNSSAAKEQARIILANTSLPPTPGSMGWVNEVAAFNTIVMDAHGVELHGQLDARSEEHKLAFSFLGSVAGELAKSVPGGGFVAGPALTWIETHTAPSDAALAAELGEANGVTINTLHASITHGYYVNGVIHPDDVPKILLVDPSNPHPALKPYESLETDGEIGVYNEWMSRSEPVLAATNETTQTLMAQMEQIRIELGH